MAKTKVTLSIEEEVWKKFRIFCIQKDSNASEILTKIMNSKISEQEKKIKK